ncbi:biotin carboxylase [Streptomyces sp. R302]|uniref:ATP-grasp domain-containing protein n=1 Tax=unclassified Streptomyces TaxID=2593676 RepID=UPI00145E026E|nr:MULTISPECIES: biotin carboxylase [unclassified Streptomyces]NML53000.1 biotin carboxylase [Streptomyces sp. R301]NML78835.1 biotin carboxylase [Streptomyces sp. R302]
MRLLILNRHSDSFAEYDRYIDHQEHEVSYVTVPEHVPMVQGVGRHLEVLPSLGDEQQVLRAAERCHREAGPFDVVFAQSEFDLLTAAAVRERLGVPGPGVRATRLFRDKPRMKEAVAEAGLRVPRFTTVTSVAQVVEFARTCGGAVVAKPRAGAASGGVVVIEPGTDPAVTLAGLDLTEYEAEEHVSGPIWHVDGLRHQGRTCFRLSSQYVGTCYGFAQGEPLASVVRLDEQADLVGEFADRCLDALDLRDGPFHLEVIESADGPVFLEVGARVGGGEIPFVLHDVYGVDLVGDWLRVVTGQPPRTLPQGAPREHAGFLMLPEPAGRTLVSRQSPLEGVEYLYAEVLPEPGHRFDGSGGYEELLGRFRYRAPSAKHLTDAVTETLRTYRYVLTEEGR